MCFLSQGEPEYFNASLLKCQCEVRTMKLTLRFALVFAFILCSTRQHVAGQTNASSIVLLQVVYRHGDRTPIRTFKNDPIPITAWKEGPGQLTKQYHNYTVPKWAKELWKDMMYQSDQSFVFLTKTPLLKRLRAGLLAANLSRNLEEAAQNKSQYKVFMYSTHDTEISAILDALGVFDGHAPPYCSALLLELWKDGPSNFSVRGFTLNAFNLKPQPLHFPGCDGEFCTLEEFLNLAKMYIPDDWQRECGLQRSFFLSDGVCRGLALGPPPHLLLGLLSLSPVLGYRIE
ncbi:hypothetical protein HPB50_018570 [Hyalomma asiaticum]|uniref:Uncharacterized protein n=1 Tax=Hyalomma asiaticum TaxID=266040 RepID=A0ACB7SXX0_HYAAI|nr:hypothetical protein HPB50_018570 [Hyalomma asiaticum]